jgi:dTDP-L-rhamnose 4-epimerase
LLATTTFYERHLMEPDSPISMNPYVRSKALAADLIRLWVGRETNRRAILGTVFQAYGHGDAPQNVLTYAADCFAKGEPATFGSGKGVRDWIHVDDLVTAIVAAITTPTTTQLTQYDFGTGETHSIRDMVLLLAEQMGVPPELATFDPTRDRGDVELIDKASNPVPNWQSKISVRDGLRKLCEHR